MKKYYATIMFLLLSCYSNKIDNDIVLKIGRVKITRYEYNKNKDRGLNENKGGKTNNNLKNFMIWKKDYMGRCFVLADAQEKKYDTSKTIQKVVENTSRFMIVQKYGYLWKRNISPIIDTFKLVTEEKAARREKMYYFDYIMCKNYDGLIKIIGNDTAIRTVAEYNKLKNKAHLYPFFETGYMTQQWPFIAFWSMKDYLYNMKEGEVSKLINFGGPNYFYFYLDHIESIELTQKEKDNFQSELQYGLEEEIENKRSKEIEIKCQPVINNKNIDALAKFISEGHTIFEYKNNLELMRYKLNNTDKVLKFDTFLEYYTYLIMRHNITDKESLKEYLDMYYSDDYLNNEAEKLGLYKTDTFLLDQKNFRNNVIYSEYIKRNIIDKIKIDSLEVIDFYNKNKLMFKQPKCITLDMYVFDKSKDALENAHKIIEFIRKNQPDKSHDTYIIKGMREFISNYKIDLEANKNYPQGFINEILSMPHTAVSNRPIPFQNKFVLFCKKGEEGQCIRKLKDVYEQIEGQIKDEKIEKETIKLVKKLRNKYKVEIDKTGIN